MTFKTLDDLDLRGKRVLIRVDLNVPMQDGRVSDDTRIRAVLPTIREVLDKGGKPILLAHFGRPKGKPNPQMSLAPVAPALEAALGAPVRFAADCVGPVAAQAVAELPEGAVLLLENLRFHPGEEANDPAFADALAALGDVYVNDAFSAAHRAHASTEALARRLPCAAGRLMQKELEALEKALARPERPVAAVVGGAKVSTKLDLLGNLSGRVERLVIGGGMANTFLAAQGLEVGRSLCERDMLDTARDIMREAAGRGCEIILPVDVVVAEEFKAHAPSRVVPAEACPADAMILDAGPQSVARICAAFDASRTLVWNGPLGAFELPPFNAATDAAARHAARLTREGRLLSVAGGGDTVAALNASGAAQDFSYVSTAGGAFLEWLEGKTLPGVAALEAC
ncbi:phosphoglycerate kinase [Oceanicella actignis]|uniref:Phosphoglycerate kinase n=1 Tax=Oceanicella actignis TaxID=1189325 RepID=A0A1M7SDD0_9RHOB|nr:phosphoglycerate kinase [Oceanicella actignis]SET25294.1 phosphoglycerate kinase [Oceanicella actignis]SHN56483.1 phosphoglycerate kinase [Oceanicella actignis]